MGIYVGRSTLISGGHMIIPVECRAGIWYLGPTIERSYGIVVFKQDKYPLRTLPAKGGDPADFEKYHCGSVSYSLTIQMYDAHLPTINIHLDSIFHHDQTTARLESHGSVLLRGFSQAVC